MKVFLVLVIHFLISGCAAPISKMSAAARAELLATEQGRVMELTDPVEKTKSYIVMAEVLLSFAAKSLQGDEIEDMDVLMRRYIETIRSARKTIVESRREARRSPAGYNDLEQALDRQLRSLQFMISLSLDYQRPSLDEAVSVITPIREEILRLLNKGTRHSP
ncbi:MAG: hypothetical protein HY646_04865 [Acidobacteria bacterium]|nr:hypothetical protein [Acidobacteriota bacterium]